MSSRMLDSLCNVQTWRRQQTGVQHIFNTVFTVCLFANIIITHQTGLTTSKHNTSQLNQ